jgi:hypothetical protein
MSTVAKILVVVNLILAGAFLASASNFLGQQENWKTKQQKTEARLEAEVANWKGKHQDATEQYNALELQANDIQSKNAGLTKERDQFSNQNDLIKQQFEQAAGQLTRSTAALQKAQETIQAQREMIDGLQSERNTNLDAVRASLEAKEAAVRNLNEKAIQFESLLAEKQALESRIEDLKQEVNSLRLTTENALAMLPEGADVPLAQPGHMGQVVAADGNLVVISLGAEDGVKPGFKYTVSRGGDYVSVIEITDVEARKSAGRAIQVLQRTPVRTGDRVSSR